MENEEKLTLVEHKTPKHSVIRKYVGWNTAVSLPSPQPSEDGDLVWKLAPGRYEVREFRGETSFFKMHDLVVTETSALHSGKHDDAREEFPEEFANYVERFEERSAEINKIKKVEIQEFLRNKGYDFEFRAMDIFDGKEPRECDVDAVLNLLRSTPLDLLDLPEFENFREKRNAKKASKRKSGAMAAVKTRARNEAAGIDQKGLIGTPAQKRWASEIRGKFLSSASSRVKGWLDGKDTKASFWIENRARLDDLDQRMNEALDTKRAVESEFDQLLASKGIAQGEHYQISVSESEVIRNRIRNADRVLYAAF